MKTPAVTMVAAWISAETGVGPSMASGSQVWRPICADLPMAPTNSRMQVTVERVDLPCRGNSMVMPAHVRAPRAKTVVEMQRAEEVVDREDAEREAEIADRG